MSARKTASVALLAALVAVLVSACSDKKNDGKTAITQVAARVNKGEVTIHQINGVLQRSGTIPPEQIKRASGAVLERLIDQELFVQQAMEKQLDRSVGVVQAIEAAKREIYARAYVEQIAAQAARPEAAAIAAFYEENPALFARRRVYNLQEFSVQIAADRIPVLMHKIGDAKNVSEIGNWLRSEKIPFSVNLGVKATEQLPLELVSRFAAAKDGQAVVTQVPSGIVIYYIVESREQPMDEKAAAPVIEQLLANKLKAELVRAEVRRLRETGTIEYLGEFAEAAGTAPAAAPAAPPAAAAQTPAAASGVADQKALVKGAAGLR